GVGRDHYACPDVPLETRRFGRAVVLARLHDGVAMADAGGRAVENGYLPALRHLNRRPQEIISLLRIGRLEHRHTSRYGVSPVVLLVLAGSHARVIGGDDDERAAHAGVGDREERVGGDVEADVFHSAERARPAESRADGDFQRYLLVRGPLGLATELGEVLEDFGGRGAGVSGPERHARVPRRERDGFVAA